MLQVSFLLWLAGSLKVKEKSRIPLTRQYAVQYGSGEGPPCVLEGQDSTYTPHDLDSQRECRCGTSYIKPFIFNPLALYPQDYNLRDYLESSIGEVLGHTVEIRLSNTSSFHVKGLGHDYTHQTWEAYSIPMKTTRLHAHLLTHKMKSLISSRFRGLSSISL